MHTKTVGSVRPPGRTSSALIDAKLSCKLIFQSVLAGEDPNRSQADQTGLIALRLIIIVAQ